MTRYAPPTPECEAVARAAVDAADKVHTSLGPGLLESVYERCLEHELARRGLRAARQHPLPISYDEIVIDAGLRIDLLVEDLVILELKAVEQIIPLHQAQVLTYLKLSGKQPGLLLNFNVVRLRDGIRRIINTPPL